MRSLRHLLLVVLLLVPALGQAEGLMKEDLGLLSDDRARSMATRFVEAVESSDPPGFLALIPGAGIKKNKKKLSPAAVKAAIFKQGLDKFVGGDGPFRVDTSARKGAWFGVYRGSGYGRTPVWFFKQSPSGEWLMSDLTIVDFGSP